MKDVLLLIITWTTLIVLAVIVNNKSKARRIEMRTTDYIYGCMNTVDETSIPQELLKYSDGEIEGAIEDWCRVRANTYVDYNEKRK